MFPTDRYAAAGASPEELAQLQATFDAMPREGQNTELERLKGLAVYDLADELEQLRARSQAQPETLLGVTEPEPGSDRAPVPDPEPNMEVPVDVGKDGTGTADIIGAGAEAIASLQVSDGDVALEEATGDAGPYLKLVVSGAKPNTTVTVSYYTQPE